MPKRGREREADEYMKLVQSVVAAEGFGDKLGDLSTKISMKIVKSKKKKKEVSFSSTDLDEDRFGKKGLNPKMDLVGPPIVESFFVSPGEPIPAVSDWLCQTMTLRAELKQALAKVPRKVRLLDRETITTRIIVLS